MGLQHSPLFNTLRKNKTFASMPVLPTVQRSREARFDPTQTTGLRRQFLADVRRRFRRLNALIWKEIIDEDGFGFKTQQQRFAFPRSDQKVEAFMDWLREQQDREILGVTKGRQLGGRERWSDTYIESAYQAGLARSTGALDAAGLDPEPIDTAFFKPIHADRSALAFTRTFSELKGVTEAMDQEISRALAQGLAEGRGPKKIAQDLQDRVNKIGKTRAEKLARTETIRAHAEASLNTFADAGLDEVTAEVEFVTAGDDRVCPICEALSGRIFSIDEARGVIPVHPNCLPGDSLVLSRTGVAAVSERWFNGEVVIICTASGRELTSTPNHPILTDRGWVAAELLDEGHNVICDGGGEWTAGVDGDYQDMPTPIHEVAEAFFGSSEVTAKPVPVAAPDFHGDGAGSEVAIIGTDRSLGVTDQAPHTNFVNDMPLKFGVPGARRFAGFRALAEFFKTALCSAYRFMSMANLLPAFVGGHLIPPQFVGGAHAPALDAGGVETPIDSAAADAELARELIDGRPCDVFADQVVSVDRKPFNGHVYNLETGGGWYSANGIITHNCRCAWVPVVRSPTEETGPDGRDYAILQGDEPGDFTSAERKFRDVIGEGTFGSKIHKKTPIISSYVGGSKPINDILRGQNVKQTAGVLKDFAAEGRIEKPTKAALLKAMREEQKPLKTDVIAYRGVDPNTSKKLRETLGDTAVGDIFRDTGFISTATNPNIGENFVSETGRRPGVFFRVFMPKGTKVIRASDAETELVLDAGTRFKIIARRMVTRSNARVVGFDPREFDPQRKVEVIDLEIVK